MKRSYYHILQVFKSACPKQGKSIISNSDKDMLNDISEGILNGLNGNIKLSECTKRNLEKYKTSLRTLVDKRMHLSAKNA
jgi:hypothetical protein